MKPFILVFVLMSAVCICAQDTIPATAEDQILQKLDFGTPSDYSWLTHAHSEPAGNLLFRDCLYYRNDSLFTGVLKTPLTDSSYRLTSCKKGKPDGEELTLQRFIGSGEFTPLCYTRPFGNDATRQYVTLFYENYRIKAKGCRVFDPCPAFQSFFGSDHGDCDYREFYENGSLKETYTLNGTDRFRKLYHPNGKLMEFQQTDSAGRACGTWKQYDDSGKRTGKLTFRNGTEKGRWNSERVRPEARR
jgi:hypothetical protein